MHQMGPKNCFYPPESLHLMRVSVGALHEFSAVMVLVQGVSCLIVLLLLAESMEADSTQVPREQPVAPQICSEMSASQRNDLLRSYSVMWIRFRGLFSPSA